jgi:thiol:disulfide interchange protein DsbD
LPVGPLVNYGYEGEVLHLVEMKAQRSLADGTTVVLAARADWLVCKEVCIPEGADLTLSLPVAATAIPDPRWSGAIAAAQSALPRPLAGWQATASGSGGEIKLRLVAPQGAVDPGTIRFFPYVADKIDPSGPQPVTREGDAYVVALPVAHTATGPFDRLAGVVTAAGDSVERVRRRSKSLSPAVSSRDRSPPLPRLPRSILHRRGAPTATR